MAGSGDQNQLSTQYQVQKPDAAVTNTDMIATQAGIIDLVTVGNGVCFGGDATNIQGQARDPNTNRITGDNYNQVPEFNNQYTKAVAAIAFSRGRLEHDASSSADNIVLKTYKVISGVQPNPLIVGTQGPLAQPNLPNDYSKELSLPKQSQKISYLFTPKATNTVTNVTIRVLDYNASAVPVFIGNETSYSVIPINYLKPNQEIEIRTGKYLSSAPSTYSDCFYISDYNIGITGEYKLIARINDYGNWLICDGRAISRTTYSALFNAIGTSFGAGDGSITFNLPDFRGRVAGAIGQGSGLTNRTLGNNLGTETHTLSSSEVGYNTWIMEKDDGDADSGVPRALVEVVKVDGVTVVPLSSPNQDFTFNVSPKNQTSHNNMQPTLFAGNYFIYAG